jgi:hypothetical protein
MEIPDTWQCAECHRLRDSFAKVLERLQKLESELKRADTLRDDATVRDVWLRIREANKQRAVILSEISDHETGFHSASV